MMEYYEASKRYVVYKPETIRKFYKKQALDFSHFDELSPDRVNEINDLVDKWRHYFETEIDGFGPRMTFAVEKLTTGAEKKFHLFGSDEKLYFFVKMVDPDFLFLEAYESSNTEKQFIAYCKRNFPGLARDLCRETMALEREANYRYQFYKDEDLWSRDYINKNIEGIELDDQPKARR